MKAKSHGMTSQNNKMTMPFLQATDTLGDFIIDSLQKEGKWASLYKAYRKTNKEQIIMIKIQVPQSDFASPDTCRALIVHEAKMLAKFRHPGIVRIYPQKSPRKPVLFYLQSNNLSDTPELVYLILEYYQSENTLKKYLNKITEFPLSWKIELIFQIAIVIYFLHESKYAHCNLSPKTIVFQKVPEETEQPQILLTHLENVISFEGTPHETYKKSSNPQYLPPEIIEALKNNTGIIYPDAIDIWALGAILFEIVAGHPLTATNPTDVDLGNMLKLEPNIGDDIHRLLMSLLTRDLERRVTIEALLNLLDVGYSQFAPPRIL